MMTMDDGASLRLAGGDGATGPGRRRNARRLWSLLAAVVLLPTAMLVAGAWGAWRLTWIETRGDLTRSVEINADYVQRSVRNLLRIAGNVAERTAALDQPASPAEQPELFERLTLLVGDQPLLSAVLVLSGSGQELLRLDTRAGDTPGRPGGGILEALARAEPGQVVFGEAYRQGSRPLVACGLRRGAAGGAVVLLLDATQIGLGLARHMEKPNDSAALLRRDGRVLARYPTFSDPLPPIGSERPMMRELAAGQAQGLVLGTTPRDNSAVAAAYEVLDAYPNLVVAAGRREIDIIANWRQALLPLLAVSLPAMLAMVALVLVVRRQQDALEAAMDGLEQRVAERTESLREGEERLRLAVEAGSFGTWETELATRQTTRSHRTIEIGGLRPNVTVSPSDDWMACIHPVDRERFRSVWNLVTSGQRDTFQEEYRFLRSDGTWRWIETHGAVVRTDPETGLPLRVAGTVQDITERREAEERRELLTQEVNHRARNTLAIVQAILRLTRADSAEEFARLVEGRVAALARAHALLAAERWSGAPLAAMLADELAPFGAVGLGRKGPESRFVLAGPPFRVRAEAVQALGMVFHELATNAVKHGALSVPAGQVIATWRVDEAKGVLNIRWQEIGGPSPGFPERRGVGSRVIEATVTGQLGGSVDRRWPEEGLVCDILLPLARVRTEPT